MCVSHAPGGALRRGSLGLLVISHSLDGAFHRARRAGGETPIPTFPRCAGGKEQEERLPLLAGEGWMGASPRASRSRSSPEPRELRRLVGVDGAGRNLAADEG